MRKRRQPAPSNRHHPEVQAHILIASTQQVAVVFAHVKVGALRHDAGYSRTACLKMGYDNDSPENTPPMPEKGA
jgi:hypothetical protein